MGKETTRDTLLEVGRQIFVERGFNNTGIDAILTAAGVPKGSFYYYFPSKEAFALEVLNRFAAGHEADLDRILKDRSVPPLERMRCLMEATAKRLEPQQCRNGCLVGNFCQELADQNEAFRERLDEILRGWGGCYAACLKEAQAAGDLSADLDPNELADFLLNSWQGAVLRAKTSRSTAPLQTFLNLIFGFVLKK
jgi:TetR/AcrR family transcriptional regulator, transcriptional repressor for nem operon